MIVREGAQTTWSCKPHGTVSTFQDGRNRVRNQSAFARECDKFPVLDSRQASTERSGPNGAIAAEPNSIDAVLPQAVSLGVGNGLPFACDVLEMSESP